MLAEKDAPGSKFEDTLLSTASFCRLLISASPLITVYQKLAVISA